MIFLVQFLYFRKLGNTTGMGRSIPMEGTLMQPSNQAIWHISTPRKINTTNLCWIAKIHRIPFPHERYDLTHFQNRILQKCPAAKRYGAIKWRWLELCANLALNWPCPPLRPPIPCFDPEKHLRTRCAWPGGESARLNLVTGGEIRHMEMLSPPPSPCTLFLLLSFHIRHFQWGKRSGGGVDLGWQGQEGMMPYLWSKSRWRRRPRRRRTQSFPRSLFLLLRRRTKNTGADGTEAEGGTSSTASTLYSGQCWWVQTREKAGLWLATMTRDLASDWLQPLVTTRGEPARRSRHLARARGPRSDDSSSHRLTHLGLLTFQSIPRCSGLTFPGRDKEFRNGNAFTTAI